MKEELFARLEELHQLELDLIKRKNADYASEQDPFLNFRMFGEYGFLVRISDKLSRVTQIVKSGETNVKDESVVDTLMDLSNYSNLLIAYLEDNKKK
jgi:hypothetical protein